MYIVKNLLCFAVAVSQLVLVDSAPTPVGGAKTSELERRGTTYPSVDQRLFNINGETQYFAGKLLVSELVAISSRRLGTNTWWLAHLFSNDDINTALSQIAAVSSFSGVLRPLFDPLYRPATKSPESGGLATPTTQPRQRTSISRFSTLPANTSTTTLPTALLVSITLSPPPSSTE